MKNTIPFLTVHELSAKIRSGEITSREAVGALIAHIRQYNPAFNAIVHINEKEALEKADEADRAMVLGKSNGLLHGIPVTIKDTYCVKGMPATAGHLPLKNHIPVDDAVLVRLLKDEGAIILGKTNTATLAMDMQTNNALFGSTNNPWDVTRTPAGSSGGCATALATGMTPLSFGSDLAGSIRVPAAFCGVYGFKPTHGVLSLEGHIPPLPGDINGIRTMAVPGPMARSIADLQLALTVLSRSNPYDRYVAPLAPDPGNAGEIKGLRIAWTDHFGDVPVSTEIRKKLQEYVTTLTRAGAIVEKAGPPAMDYNEVWELWGRFVGMQNGYEMSDFKRWIGDLFTRKKVRNIPMHRKVVGPISVGKMMKALELQSKYVTMIDNFLSEYDAWICPVASTTAFRHHACSSHLGDFKIYDTPLGIDGRQVPYYVATQSCTTIFSVTNSPVLSMPIGLGESGLPVNIQVAGRRHHDFRLLRVAALLDQHAEKITYPLQKQAITDQHIH